MGNLTVRAPDDLLEALDDEADDRGIARAEHVRRLLGERHESDERVVALEAQLDECEDRADALETDLERARRARRAANDRAEDIGALARTREREQSLAERRAQAGVLTRARWWLRGMDE